MKINLENMKKLAEKLDHNNADVDISAGDILIMAYQLQYFFEAMEYIAGRCEFWKDAHFKDDRAMYQAYRDSLNNLNKALIEEE